MTPEEQLAEANLEITRLRQRKDDAYRERNTVVALLARIMYHAGWNAGVSKHEPDPDPSWDPEWLTLVAIDLPTGQVSWHFHDSDAHLVADLPQYRGSWDGHDTPEKYRRVVVWDGRLATVLPVAVPALASIYRAAVEHVTRGGTVRPTPSAEFELLAARAIIDYVTLRAPRAKDVP